MRILVGVDGSEAAERAVSLATRMAKGLGGTLKIIHVISPANLAVEELQDYALREHVPLSDVLNAFAEEKLTTARKLAEALGISSVETETPFGDIAETIIESARHDSVDLIVLGKRGRGRISGLLLGSTSQKVMTLAPCAVTVVP